LDIDGESNIQAQHRAMDLEVAKRDSKNPIYVKRKSIGQHAFMNCSIAVKIKVRSGGMSMHRLLSTLIEGVDITGEIEKDVCSLLRKKGYEEIADHTLKVANRAREIAANYGVSVESAYAAGVLHDIGNLVPIDKRVYFCNELGIKVIEVEKVNPALLHSKISKIIAQDIFMVEEDICDAIECHSTLKANAGKLDLVLFVADKLSWDSIHNKDFIHEMMKALDVSLEYAAYTFTKHLYSRKDIVLHPRTIEAYSYLEGICN
jgi:predicted HD superfamily hydrolase involved in NAD metabolism